MTHELVLDNKVREVRTRIRLLLAQQWAFVGLTWATVAALILVAATKFRWWTDAIDYIWAILVIGGIAGLIVGWTRQITPLVAAQIADERGGLKERLSTAVELSRGEAPEDLARAQIADAAEHARRLRVGEVLPWRVPAFLKYFAAAVAVLLAVIFVPELPIFHSAQDRADREAMKQEGQRIIAVAKKIEKSLEKKKDDENAAIIRRIAQSMKQLGKDQAHNRIPKKEAMLQMNELTKQLKDAENKLGAGKAQKAMDKVASDLLDSAMKQSQAGNQEAANALKQMAENLQKRDLDAAKRQLEELAKKMQAGNMSKEEMKNTAESLEAMAKAMDGSSLAQASDQMKDAANKLREAAQTAKKFEQQMAQAKSDAERQQLQQQMSQAMSQSMGQASQQTQKAGGT
jgi:hypothetical protein